MGRGGGFDGGRSGGFGGMGGGRSGGFGGNLGGGRGGQRPSPRGRHYRPPRYRPMGMPIPMGPVIINGQQRPRRKNRHPAPQPNGGGSKGCLTALLTIVLIGLVLLLLFRLVGGAPSSIQSSSRDRQPLPEGSVVETPYITDQAGWINQEDEAIPGPAYFYDQTGVQPHLVIATHINGQQPTDPQVIANFAEDFYDQHFEDEAHLLVIFYEPRPNHYLTYYLAGNQAQSVIDDQAGQILLDVLDANYTNSHLSDEAYFSQSFKKAADRIMTKDRSPWPWIAGLAIIAIIVYLIYNFWQKRQQAERQKQKETEELLSRPIESFGQQKLNDLEKKYQEDTDQ